MRKISESIKIARLNNGLSQLQLAEKCGWGQGRISNYERGDREPKSSDIRIIATALNMTAEELLIGRDNTLPAPIKQKVVPLISWVQAGAWEDINDIFHPQTAEEFYPCPENHSKYTYALKVVGESMWPDFIEGDIIFVDPETEARNGSCVIVRQNGNTEATFKQLIIDGSQKYLKALNPNWPNPIIEMLPDATISGVVIGSYRKRI